MAALQLPLPLQWRNNKPSPPPPPLVAKCALSKQSLRLLSSVDAAAGDNSAGPGWSEVCGVDVESRCSRSALSSPLLRCPPPRLSCSSGNLCLLYLWSLRVVEFEE
ncbi:hypothetical protein Syun_005522 [Stephania yunnanensis]|uniref:Uncharacterized protein n=1 Tax=Stephania yunnanensis TaxID=152371 RepID=A0AAP0Q2D0_9MAGN